MKLRKRTPRRVKLVDEIRLEWLDHGLATSPADREAAEAGARRAYEHAGIRAPDLVVWLDSPLKGAVASAMMAGTERPFNDLRDQIWDHALLEVRDQVLGRVRVEILDPVWRELEEQVGFEIWRHLLESFDRPDPRFDGELCSVSLEVKEAVEATAGRRIPDLVAADSWVPVRNHALRAIYGQHDAADLAYFDFVRRCGIRGTEKLDGICQVAKNAGWWWPSEDIIILTERPTVLHRDCGGRLHCEDGPAVIFPDGWGIWATHGVRVEALTVESTGRR